MKIFVINLKRNPERRQNIELQLNALGLPFEISEGVDAQNFTETEQEAYVSGLKNGTHNLPPGLFGSSWAHIKVYEKIVARNLPLALVLEDDVILDPRLKQVLEESWIKESFWDFVHLGYPPASVTGLVHWFKVTYQQVKIRPGYAIKAAIKAPAVMALHLFEITREGWRGRFGPKPVKFARSLYLGDGYLVTLQGAKKLLSIAFPIHYTGDQLFNEARTEADLRFYGYCPPVVRPNGDFPSETGYIPVGFGSKLIK